MNTVLAISTRATVRIDEWELPAGKPTPVPDDPAFLARLLALQGVAIVDPAPSPAEPTPALLDPLGAPATPINEEK